jgi:hypothetical protein
VRRGHVDGLWEHWVSGVALVLFALTGLGLLLSLWVDGVLLTVVGVTFVGFVTLMRIVGAFGR